MPKDPFTSLIHSPHRNPDYYRTDWRRGVAVSARGFHGVRIDTNVQYVQSFSILWPGSLLVPELRVSAPNPLALLLENLRTREREGFGCLEGHRQLFPREFPGPRL